MFNTTHFATTVLPFTIRYFSCTCDMTHHASYIRDTMHSCVTRLSPMCNRTSLMFNTTQFVITVLPPTLRHFSCICDMTHHASYIRDPMLSCETRLGPMCNRTSPMYNMTHFVTTVLPSTMRHASYIRDTMH